VPRLLGEGADHEAQLSVALAALDELAAGERMVIANVGQLVVGPPVEITRFRQRLTALLPRRWSETREAKNAVHSRG
jgi:hypothetical protein